MIKHIYYINLDKDIERRSQMEEQLRHLFPLIPFTRFGAIDRMYVFENQKAISPRVQGTYLQEKDGKFPRPGAIGCYLSHESIIKSIISSNKSNPIEDIYMVLEDDCKIDEDFLEYFSSMIKYLNEINFEWTVLKPVCRLFDNTHKVNNFLYKTSLAKDLHVSYYFGAHMLFYNTKKIEKLYQDLCKIQIKDIDYILNREVDGVFAFELGRPEMVRQSNLGGSNTTDNQSWSAYK